MRALESLEKSLRELPTRELQRDLYRELPTIEKILLILIFSCIIKSPMITIPPLHQELVVEL